MNTPVPIPEGYSTHIPILTACLAMTDGPVLELGSGNYSTLLLHTMCSVQDRHLLTIDFDAGWLNAFRQFQSPKHTLKFLNERDSLLIPEILNVHWSVIFMDHAPGARRGPDLVDLKECGDLFVLHDTDDPGYGWGPALPYFIFSFEWSFQSPRTRVVSATHPELIARLQRMLRVAL